MNPNEAIDIDMQDVSRNAGVVNDVTLAPAIDSIDPREIFGDMMDREQASSSSPRTGMWNQTALTFKGVNQPRPLSDYPKSRKTGLVYDLQMMLHAPINYNVNGDAVYEDELDEFRSTHPEDPKRISFIFAKLKAAQLVETMVRLPCPEVTSQQALLVHTDFVWQDLEKTTHMSEEQIKAEIPAYEHMSLYVNNHTALASRLSCGGVISACEAVITGVVRNAIAVVRPPGHHAEPDQSLGFCFLNNVAVAIKVIQRDLGVKKIMIVDWDVHHGNGTQRVFYDDPNVLYISIHRHDGGRFYPCSDFGALDMVGNGEAAGTSVNIPWPGPGFGDSDYMYAFQEVIMPIAYEFAPDLVIISAGFDAADGDELGGCKVTPMAYAHMTHMLMGLAGGKLVVALEGGYNLEAISNSAEAVTKALVGEPLDIMRPMRVSELGNEVVYQVVKMQSQFWRCLRGKNSAPIDIVQEPEEETVDLREVMKQYRAHRLCSRYRMFVVPLANRDLDKMFPDQVFSDQDLFKAKTVVLFVHDFGNFWNERQNSASIDADLEKSRLVEYSNLVMDWTRKNKFSIIDVNTTVAYPAHRSQLPANKEKWVTKHAPKPWVDLMKYIWDNYLSLLDCENIIMFGFGTGCESVMSLVNSRDVEEKVRTVISVGGMNTLVRPDPTNDAKREWYRGHSRLYLPHNHPAFEEPKIIQRLRTQIETTPGISPLDILPNAMPSIIAHVNQCLSKKPTIPVVNGVA